MRARGGKPLVVVAAGGTGGHLFPAEALSTALERRGIIIDLATDERATRYGTTFPARATHVIASATFRRRNPISLIRTTAVLGWGTAKAFALLGKLKPAAVVGFGGYPTIPPVLAATLRGIPTLIHEQNGVLGRANRLLSRRVQAIATSFPGVLDAEPPLAAKATQTGNPVREVVIEASKTPFSPVEPNGPLHLLVFGGSQGARVMADIVPPAVERLPYTLRRRLSVVQQARDEDLPRVREAYALAGAHGAVTLGRVPRRRLDRRRARRHRPPSHFGAVAPRTRSGPACQRYGAGARRRGHLREAGGVLIGIAHDRNRPARCGAGKS
jgi:UDP-N-acetylglucosamine--N-acetylmuramyl-(pentapeptide) pyrophosphoryl-undecaprenol N-acetylglucosamine transferase